MVESFTFTEANRTHLVDSVFSRKYLNIKEKHLSVSNTGFFIDGRRILTPDEVFSLYRSAAKDETRSRLMFLVATGMRWKELNAFLLNPEWYVPERYVIHYKSDKAWNRERIFPDRDIYLSYFDAYWVDYFIKSHLPIYRKNKPSAMDKMITLQHGRFDERLWVWSQQSGIGREGMSVSSIRKTRFAWLLHAFPECQDIIQRSLNHDPYNKGIADDPIESYLSIPFSSRDREMIAAILSGWKASALGSL